MYPKLLSNDIKKNRLISIIIVAFITTASLLTTLASTLMVNLVGAVDHMMVQGKTPHFLQMQSGDLSKERLETFADKHPNVKAFQILEFLNVESAQIYLGEHPLSDSVQDNGFSVQGEQFDYLTDLDGNILHPKEGQVYVPLTYRDDPIKVGDPIKIGQTTLTMAGFLRDSQMNSDLSSSKRFLINQKDYDKIKSYGKVEYLIEFRLNDLSQLSAFETDYVNAGLPNNGPTVTYPLFRMINSVSDVLVIALLMLGSLLVVAVAFLCIRFTLLTTIEEDLREIGVMKAIGLPLSHIRRIYLAKYALFSLVGCLVGFLLSFLFRQPLLANLQLYMGSSPQSILAPAVSIVGILLIILFIILFVSLILRRFCKISPTEVLRFGFVPEKRKITKTFRLSTNRIFHTNVFLGLQDVLIRKKLYLTMMTVLIIAIFIMSVPQNIYHTISSKDFVRSMGMGRCQLLIGLQQTDRIIEKRQLIDTTMSNDPAITKHVVLTSKIFETKTKSEILEHIKIEFGDHSVFPVRYSNGHFPQQENEIALSSINAQELDVSVGDFLTVIVDELEKNLTVSGIYPDITNGGKTAKAIFPHQTGDILWINILADISSQVQLDKVVQEYSVAFPYAKVADIETYFSQVYGPTVKMVRRTSYGAILIALLISGLVILLFMKMLVKKDRHSIAILKMLGYTSRDIQVQYLCRGVFILTISLLLGSLLTKTGGEKFGCSLMALFGSSDFHFTVNPWITYVLFPIFLTTTVVVSAIFGTHGITSIQVYENIKE